MFAGSSSAIQSKNMDESTSVSVDSNCKSIGSNELAPRQSKALHGKKSIVLPDSDIEGLLECPVCSNSMFPPIQQCPSGHTLCLSCKNKVNNKCPICRKEIGNIRCLALEKLAVSLHLPCAYHHLGCEESEARRFGYCLEVGGNGRKLTWQGVPRSIRTHHRTVRDSNDGLIVQRRLALYFSGGDRKELKLRVTGRIWREI
ncbi:hypothetical protein COCNU_03G000080 [Cocos nucifera]|uniref:RING-type domain-containing protein n=1 Tax=Cocos nucifera TaxID=13894 RepID=A0A8K0I1P8_COCNU|nr:hypothetical protein COCNU_03G000080 [Cocos nucifera]